jgi:recombination protein RecR
MLLPEPIQNLVDSFSRLPGIGPKTASRLAFYLLRAPDDLSHDLAEALQSIKTSIIYCPTCFNITSVGMTECEICASSERDATILCVVEEPLDVLALERTSGFRGRYHVLEVILATNPSMEGDATAMYLRQRIESFGVRVTRLARGLPVGGDLEYADTNTLLRALDGRQEMS